MGACPGSTYEGVDAMGRGRQKAKQTKVARQLKYFSPDTDYNALQRELAHTGEPQPQAEVEVDDTDDVEQFDDESTDDDVDEYASWVHPPR
jgi:hypothetical protein